MDVEVQGCLDIVFSLYRKKMEKGSEGLPMKKLKVETLYGFAIAMVILMLGIVLSTGTQQVLSFPSSKLIDFSSNWQVQIGGELKKLSTPVKVQNEENDTLILQKKLPKSIKNGEAFFLRSTHQIVEVYVEEELIYSYGNEEGSVFSKDKGKIWNIVPLDKSMEGKDITVYIQSPYSFYGKYIGKSYIGTSFDFFIQLLKEQSVNLIVGTIMVILGFVLLLFGRFITNPMFSRSAYYLSVFSVLVGIWVILQSHIAQFLSIPVQAKELLYYEILMLIPVPLLWFLKQFYRKELESRCKYLALFVMGNFVLCNILQICGIMDFPISITFTHITLAVVALEGGYEICQLAKEYPTYSYLKYGVIGLAFTVALDISQHYFDYGLESIICTLLGICFFLILIVVTLLKNVFQKFTLADQAKHLKSIAYVDDLTGIYNRRAFDEIITQLEETKEDWDKYCMINIDLNNLKKINDELGHSAGDQLITSSVDLLRESFGSIASCYRLGGDEFMVLAESSLEKCKEAMERVHRRQQLYNEEHNIPIDFAYGMVCYDKDIDANIRDTLKRADREMYDMKEAMKHGNRNGV